MSNGLIVWSRDNSYKVALAQDRILRENVATKVSDLLIHPLKTVGLCAESGAPQASGCSKKHMLAWDALLAQPSGQRTTRMGVPLPA